MFINILYNYFVFLITFSIMQTSLSLNLCVTLFFQSVTACSAASASVRSVCICHSVISEKLSDLILFSFDHFRRISLWSESVWCSVFTVQHFRKSSLQMMSARFMIKISEMNFDLIEVSESFFISSLNCSISASSRPALLHALAWEFQSRLWILKSFSSSIQFCMNFS